MRIVTWNVNGIRNPFGYQPWRDRRTFEGMFDILEADIVVFQETKIQRKDLRDDMVLVPGWDCYWSLPRHKKGLLNIFLQEKAADTSQATPALSYILETRHVLLYVRRRDSPGFYALQTPRLASEIYLRKSR